MAQDIRWLQRFSNYCKALAKLGQAVDIVSRRLELANRKVLLPQYPRIERKTHATYSILCHSIHISFTASSSLIFRYT